MAQDPPRDRLRRVAFRIVRTAEGVVLKRAATEISILGDGAAEFVESVVAAIGEGASRAEICAQFSAPEQALVGDLVDQLVASRLLQVAAEAPPGAATDPGADSHLDLLYWQLGDTARAVTERIDRAGVVLVGRNPIMRQLARTLVATGVTALRVIDDPRLRDDRAARGEDRDEPLARLPSLDGDARDRDGRVGCLVAGSSHGDQHALRTWNARCVERGQRFLPVLLQNFVGYVGPVVVPGESACFDCLRARWNARVDQVATLGAVDDLAVEDRGIVGFHPAMASMLGDLASFELTRLLGGGLPNRRIGVQIELNLLRPQLTTRRVLKVPRCPTCSPLLARAAASPRR